MGAGIAEVAARAGCDVVVIESDAAAVQHGIDRLTESLKRAEVRGKIESADGVLARLRVVDDIEALADRDIVIEAIVEDEAAKTALFARLDEIVASSDAILASNTSSIPIMKLAVATNRPAQVIGIHFFNPVPVLPLVELVPSLLTAPEVTDQARGFVEGLGKQPILCQDRAGFVVNALLIPFILSAIRMLESGFATAEDIDRGLVLGAAHPQGPLALADLIGLDTTKAVAESLYEEFKEPLYAAPPLLARMVSAGLLGRKAGRGFYTYV
jgi:3-hydroxybutyryl-CoA dehydrogenase